MRAMRWLGLAFLVPTLMPACANGDVEPVSEASSAMPSPDDDDDGDGFLFRVDCDDRDPYVHPGAKEICNGKDDNCDGAIDEGFDRDGDGWVACAVAGKRADCDDDDRLVNPGAAETCNGKDDNCDGNIDEGRDDDGDGFTACGQAGAPSDCDDTSPNVRPGATEQCNGKDDDCNGKIDEIPATLEGALTPPVNPHWALAGAATIANGWAQLTPEQTNAAGALWWNASYLFDTFEVTATIFMPKRSDCADGLAFAFVPGNDVTRVGGPGPGFGVLGLGGLAIAIDTYANVGEPAPPFLVVYDAQSGAHLHRQSIPEVRDARDHKLRVRLDGGKISVWLDYVGYVADLTIPAYAPFTGHWGFTAGTGGQTCAHFVRNVTMSFPNGQGCIP